MSNKDLEIMANERLQAETVALRKHVNDLLAICKSAEKEFNALGKLWGLEAELYNDAPALQQTRQAWSKRCYGMARGFNVAIARVEG